jgi:hypothetical protein
MQSTATATATTETAERTLADDLLIGAAPIAEYLGLTERACRHQLDRNQIPHRRMGRLIVASKRVLRKHFEEVV